MHNLFVQWVPGGGAPGPNGCVNQWTAKGQTRTCFHKKSLGLWTQPRPFNHSVVGQWVTGTLSLFLRLRTPNKHLVFSNGWEGTLSRLAPPLSTIKSLQATFLLTMRGTKRSLPPPGRRAHSHILARHSVNQWLIRHFVTTETNTSFVYNQLTVIKNWQSHIYRHRFFVFFWVRFIPGRTMKPQQNKRDLGQKRFSQQLPELHVQVQRSWSLGWLVRIENE